VGAPLETAHALTTAGPPGEHVNLAQTARSVWTVDCGASRHCVNSPDELTIITRRDAAVHVQVADGQVIVANLAGDVDRFVSTADGPRRIRLRNVLVVPGFVGNLFSCACAFEADGIRTELNGARCLILPDDTRVPFLPVRGRYLVDLSPPRGGVELEQANTAATDHPDNDLLHARLGHFGYSRIKSAIGKTAGIEAYKGHSDCVACAKGSMRTQRFEKKPKTEKRVFTYFGECVTSDGWAVPAVGSNGLHICNHIL
jgi:hypothetical protein